jgi:hypothetical protein
MPWATIGESDALSVTAVIAVVVVSPVVPGSLQLEQVTIETMEAQVEHAPVVPITVT